MPLPAPAPDAAAVQQWLRDLLDRQRPLAQSLDISAIHAEAEAAQLLQQLLVGQLGGVRARGPVDHRFAILQNDVARPTSTASPQHRTQKTAQSNCVGVTKERPSRIGSVSHRPRDLSAIRWPLGDPARAWASRWTARGSLACRPIWSVRPSGSALGPPPTGDRFVAGATNVAPAPAGTFPVETDRAEVAAGSPPNRGLHRRPYCLRSLAGTPPVSGSASVRPVSSVSLLGRGMQS